MHHISILVQALTPKLNPNPLPGLISRLVTVTMPSHFRACNSQHSWLSYTHSEPKQGLKHTYLCYCSLLLVTLPFPLPLIGVETAAMRYHPPPAGRLDQSDTKSTLIYPDTTKWSIHHTLHSELSKVAINTCYGTIPTLKHILTEFSYFAL